MKRGRIFIYLALIIIIGLVAGYFYFSKQGGGGAQKAASQTQTAVANVVQVVSAAANIAPGTQITADMLSSYPMPKSNLVQGLFTNPADVVNMYAKVSIPQGSPITAAELSATVGNINLPGSSWASYIPQGFTAVSLPITRLSSAAFGIRDGDYVNVIVSMALLDIDPGTQSILPQKVASVKMENGSLTITPVDLVSGHFEADETANALVYLYPAENQRPRMVTQMIMQNIQVLHVGSFPLPGETGADQLASQAAATPAATPQPANENQTQVVTTIAKPDIITLMVSPQDAVTLTYLVYSQAQINLTLRNPSDQDAGAQPDAAMLEYLLTQYNIPVPAKLPYSTNPRLDSLVQPVLTNDIPVP